MHTGGNTAILTGVSYLKVLIYEPQSRKDRRHHARARHRVRRSAVHDARREHAGTTSTWTRSWRSQTDWSGKKLQVHGYVVPGSIGKKRDALEYRFDIQRNGKTMRAFYNGIVPDTFKDDSEVVLTGVLTQGGLHGRRT